MFDSVHTYIQFLNNSKIFAGIMMISINLLTKFVPIQFSKSLEEFFKATVHKFVLVFCMAWLGTRDIYVALILAICFTVFSDYLMNEESPFCILPEKYRFLSNSIQDTNGGDLVSDTEHQQAMAILEKYKKQKQREQQRADMLQFHQWERTT